MAAQIVRASGESALGVDELPPDTNVVVLSVPDEAALKTIDKQLALAGIPHVMIQEVDPPFDGQCTAIGLVPLADRAKVKPIGS